MQPSEIISVNLWQMAISLCNLFILFLILKRFLYRPVKKVLAERRATLDAQYAEAEAARREAHRLETEWSAKLAGADAEADAILKQAAQRADKKRSAILSETREQAARILSGAEAEAELERKKAEAGLREELVELSTALSEKLLSRELTSDDHRALIDSFLSELPTSDAPGSGF